MAATATLYHAQLTGWERIKEFFNAKFINILALFLFLLLAVFLLFPIFAVLVKSFQSPEGFTLAHYKNFFTHAYFFQSLYNTLLLGLINTIICVSVGFCFAYMTTRGPMALRKPLKIVAMIPLIAPPYLFALSLIILFGRVGLITTTFGVNWEIYGFDGVVIAQTLAFIPLAFLMLENNIKSLNPNLEESAYDMGATEGTIIRTITLPLLTPGLLKAALLVFVMTIAEFGNAAVLGGRVPFLAPDTYTMIVGEADFSMGSVLSVMLIMPCITIFIAHNYLLKGKKFTTIEGKPIASEPRKMSLFVKVPFIAITFFFGFTIFICFAVVIMAAFVNILGVRNEFVMRHIMDFRSNMAIWNSIKVSFIAALIGGIIGTLLAYVIVRGKFVGRNLIEMISLSGFALPGTVIGVGYLIAFASPPMKLTGGIMILALNCVFRFLAVGVEAGITKLHQINIEIEEASWDMGATFFTTFRRIVLPIMFPAFIAGFIYTFMTAMVSLSAVVFLVSPGYELAAVAIFDAAAYGKIGLASATTLKMIMVVILCMIILNLLTKFTNLNIERKGGAA